MTAASAIRQSDGVVYFMANLAMETVKVGYTTNLKKRLDVLQTGNHNRLEICCFIRAPRVVEQLIHQALVPFVIRNEWFKHDASVDGLIRKIEEFEIEHGLKTGGFSPTIFPDDFEIIRRRWADEPVWKL
jgi:hypothetical protein